MATIQHISAELPDVDQWGTPLVKMPPCPNCREDELGMIERDRAVCNLCNCVVTRSVPGTHILDLPAICGDCPWTGLVQDCEQGASGDLLCPSCSSEIAIRLAKVVQDDVYDSSQMSEPEPPNA